jgi:hypothetical protein
MDTQLLTDDMVAQLRAEINQIVQQSTQPSSAPARLHAFEQGLRQTLNRLGAQLTQRQVEAEAKSQEKGPQPCPQCGEAMRNVKRASVTVQSIFGSLRVHRTHFHCRACAQSFYPLDACYGWSPHRFTSTAKEWVCLMTQGHAYETAVEILGRVSGIQATVETLRDVTQESGQRLLERRQAQVRLVHETEASLPLAPAPTPWMLVGVDGCQVLKSGEGVGRRKQKKRGKKRHRARGEAAGEGRGRERGMEVKVGVIGTLRARRGGEYRVEKKSYLTTLQGVEAFAELVFCESMARGVLKAALVVVIGDGAVWIWERVARLYERRVEILDWYHLSEKVWESAEGLYGARTEREARRWVQRVLDQLWEGKVAEVLRSLQKQRQRWEERGEAGERGRVALQGLAHYLAENQGRMDYPRYRGQGLPIGSGVVEAACKEVVGGRMKRSGMQWRKSSAETVLHLRAEFCSGRWDEDWEYLRAAA